MSESTDLFLAELEELFKHGDPSAALPREPGADPNSFSSAARRLRPASRFGMLFGVTEADIRAAALTLDGEPSLRPIDRIIKRAIDVLLGTALLITIAPVFLAAALAIKLTSRGPILFAQQRVGLNGEPFTLWKFRTMYADAEQYRAVLADGRDPRDGLLFKMTYDPRITPVGRILRRYSIDELPQLWSVVAGDMSLVGPRPPFISELEHWPKRNLRRQSMKPGLTGLWQVTSGGDETWEDAVRLDLRYVDNYSLALDLHILLKTLRAAFRNPPRPSAPAP